MQLWLRIAGCAYLLWLAWVIGRRGPLTHTQAGRTGNAHRLCRGLPLAVDDAAVGIENVRRRGWEMASVRDESKTSEMETTSARNVLAAVANANRPPQCPRVDHDCDDSLGHADQSQHEKLGIVEDIEVFDTGRAERKK
jgi:hypothetical protein